MKFSEARSLAVGAAYKTRQAIMRWPALGSQLALARFLPSELRTDRDAGVVREVRRRYKELLERDLDNVRQGVYPAPLLFSPSWRDHARAVPELLRQLPSTWVRAKEQNFEDLPAEATDERYPSYYRRNFHWQTDGYLSARSAEVYDLEVDWLFLGALGAMRRQVLPPMVRYAQQHDGRSLRILDVACGTGHTLELIHAAIPTAALFGIDLSPHYVDHARERLGDCAALSAENAESLSFADDSFDIVTSTYLFHELPKGARRRVMAEIARVLRSGGLFVIQDSAQSSESPEIASTLAGFSRMFHEPYYPGYVRDDLSAALAEVGLEVDAVETHFVAKVVYGNRA